MNTDQLMPDQAHDLTGFEIRASLPVVNGSASDAVEIMESRSKNSQNRH